MNTKPDPSTSSQVIPKQYRDGDATDNPSYRKDGHEIERCFHKIVCSIFQLIHEQDIIGFMQRSKYRESTAKSGLLENNCYSR